MASQAHPPPDSATPDSDPPAPRPGLPAPRPDPVVPRRDASPPDPPASGTAPASRVTDPALERIRAEIRVGADGGTGGGTGGQPGRCVLTGGQTGVDTASALAALRVGLVTHVVFPHGFRQEDGPLTAARRRRLRGAALHELESPEFAARTWSCVRLADAVVLIDPAGGEGCRETVLAAASLGRPLLDLGPDAEPVSPVEITGWLRQSEVRVLQIAGCRASRVAAGLADVLDRQVSAVVYGARAWHQELTSRG